MMREDIINSLLSGGKSLKELAFLLKRSKKEIKGLLTGLVEEKRVEVKKNLLTNQTLYALKLSDGNINRFSLGTFYKNLYSKFTKNKYFNNTIIFLSIFILVFIVYFWQYGLDYWKYDPVRDGWWRCLDDLKSGVLYKYNDGGYIDCNSSPLVFYILYPFKLIAKDVRNLFLLYTSIFSLLLTTLSLFLIYKISLKEIKKYRIYFIPILFLLYLMMVNTPSLGQSYLFNMFEHKISIFLIINAFYFLFYTNVKYKEIISSTFLTTSFFIKLTNAPIIAIILIYHFINLYKKDKNIKFLISKSYNFLIPFVIITTIQLILNSSFVKIIPILFSMGNDKMLQTFIAHKWILTKFSWGILFLSLIFIVSLFYFIKDRNIFSAISFFGLIIILFNILLKNPEPADFYFMYRYLYPIFPFFFLLITKKLSEEDNLFKKIILIITISLFLIPTLNVFYLTHFITKLDHQLTYPITFIPKQEGYVLSDENRFDWYGNKLVSDQKFDTLFRIGIYDGVALDTTEKFNLVNKTNYLKKENEKLDYYKQRLLNGNYSLVSVGPIDGISSVDEVMNSIDVNTLNTTESKNFNYLGITIPSLEREKTRFLVYFKDVNQYNYFRNRMLEYYNIEFDSICKKSRLIGLNLAGYIRDSSLPFYKICNVDSKKDIYISYMFNSFISQTIRNDYAAFTILEIFVYKRIEGGVIIGKFKVSPNFKLILSILIILSIIFGVYLSLNDYLNSQNHYIILFILLGLLIILLISFVNIKERCSIPYVTMGNQTQLNCCLDQDENGVCDEFDDPFVKECLVNIKNNIIPLGRECSNITSCERIVKDLNLSINKKDINCKDSLYNFVDMIGVCRENRDCLRYFDNNIYDYINHSLKCKEKLCTLLDGLRKNLNPIK